CGGMQPLDILIYSERAEYIFVVIPATHGHYGCMDILKIRKDVSLFPKLIVVGMLHHLVPKRDPHAQLLLVKIAGVFHPSHLQKELVLILSAPQKWFEIVVIARRHRQGLSKSVEEVIIL